MQKMLLSRYSLYLKVIICQAFVLGLLLVIKMIQALKKYQTHTNAGMFGALQDAATYALNHYDEFLEKQNEIFRRRRDNFESQLKHAHLPFVHSKGGIYIWLHTPGL